MRANPFEKMKILIKDHKNYFSTSQHEIAKKNLKQLRMISSVLFFVVLFFLVATPYLIPEWSVTYEYIVFLISIVPFIILSYYMNDRQKNIKSIKILCVAFCLDVGVFLGIIDIYRNTGSTSVFISLIFVLLAILFVLEFKIILLIMSSLFVLYLCEIQYFEYGEVRLNDTYHIFVGFIIGIVVLCVLEISRAQDTQDAMHYKSLSRHDALTAIYNKGTCEDMVANYLFTKSVNEKCALLIMDIDNFKHVNDAFGHSVGDIVLCDFSKALRNIFGSHNIIGRIGGDEFMVLINDVQDDKDIFLKCQNLKKLLTYKKYDDDYSITCSIGIAFLKDKKCRYYPLFQVADNALYEAKRAGKNRFVAQYYKNENKPNIIIIDSDEKNVKTLYSIFEDEYNIKSVMDRQSALDILENHKNSIDAVLINVNLPEIDGKSLIHDIRKELGGKRMAVLAMLDDDSYSQEIIENGADEVLLLPINETVAQNRLQNILINNKKS